MILTRPVVSLIYERVRAQTSIDRLVSGRIAFHPGYRRSRLTSWNPSAGH